MTVIINGTTGITNVNGSAAAPAETGTDTDTGIVYGTNTITLATNGTAGLVQDASQNVGVGISSPSAKLHVQSTLGAEAAIIGTSAQALYFRPDTGGTMVATGAGQSGTGTYYASTSNFMYFMTGSAERARINQYGIGLGGAVPSSGTGITFPATQSASTDANTLDDYEEGSFTAQLADNTSGGNSYSVGGTYIKIGRMVQIQIASYALATATFTAGNTIYIRNLPFATSGEGCAGAFEMNTTAADRAVYAWQPNGNTYFVVKRVNWLNAVLGSDMQATTYIYGNFTYQST